MIFFCMVTSRTNRKILDEPTAVNRLSELAGNGPPCCMALETTTPVGTSFIIILPIQNENRQDRFQSNKIDGLYFYLREALI